MIFSEKIALVVSADTGGATRPLGQLATQASKTESAFDKAAKAMGVSSATLKTGLVAGAAALVGTGLVDYLNDSITAYAESAKAASDLANATGGTVDEVSRLTAAMTDAGVSADTTAGLLTKFTTNAGKQTQALEELNISLVTGSDGTVDYAASMVAVVDAIGDVGDSSRRNTLLVQFFGKAGAKAFQDLYNSGVDLSEAMAAIDKYRVFDADDVRSAMAYDDAMDQLTASAQGLQFALGRTLAPALTAVSNTATPMVEALASLDGKTILLSSTAIALAMNQGRVVAAVGLAGAAMRRLGDAIIEPLTIDFTGLGIAADSSAAAMERNAVAAGTVKKTGTAGVVAGLTKGLIAVAVAWEVASSAVDAYTGKLDQVLASTGDITDETARQALESMSLWEKLGGALQDIFSWEGQKQLFSWGGPSKQDEIDNTRKRLEELRAEQDQLTAAQGPAAVAASNQADAQKTLNNLLASGTASQEDLAAATAAAAAAQHTQETNTARAKDAIAAYSAATWDAVNATLAQIDKEYARDEAQRSYRAQIAETNRVLSGKSSADERAAALDDLGKAALTAAQAEVELATQNALLEGTTLSAAQKNDLLISSLRREKKGAGTKAERAEIQALIDKLTTARTTAGEGIEIGGIKFKAGTTKKQVDTLQADIKAALKMKDYDLAADLQAKLAGLELPDLTQQVNLVGPDGKPLTSPSIDVNVTTVGQDAVQATLDGLAKTPRKVQLKLSTTGQDHVRAVLDDLDRDRDVWINIHSRNVGSASPGAGATTSSLGGRIGAESLSIGALSIAGTGSRQVTELQPRTIGTMQVNVHLDSKRIASYLTTSSGGRP